MAIWIMTPVIITHDLVALKKNLMAIAKDNPNPSHVMSVYIAITIPKNIIAKCSAK